MVVRLQEMHFKMDYLVTDIYSMQHRNQVSLWIFQELIYSVMIVKLDFQNMMMKFLDNSIKWHRILLMKIEQAIYIYLKIKKR